LVYSPASGTCIPANATAVTSWIASLTANQGSGDTTASVNVSAGTLPGSGYFLVDSEWEQYTGSTSLGGGNYTLTGITRAEFITTAAAHSSGAFIQSAVFPFSAPSNSLFAWIGSGTPQFLAIDCPTGSNNNGEVVFEVGCPTAGFVFFSDHAFGSWVTEANTLYGPLVIGVQPNATPDSPDQHFEIAHTANVLQTTSPADITAGNIAFSGGIPGAYAVQTATAPAPVAYLSFVPTGSTTYTYQCQGADKFGGIIPGAPLSFTNLAASGWGGPSMVHGWCNVPGAVATTIFRTAGGPNQGYFASGAGPILTWQDNYTSATVATPGTNTTVPFNCTGGTATNPQWCETSGTSPTPSFSCPTQNGITTTGWLYHIAGATTTPFAEVCNGTSFVTAY
jgi:hypothetical protein